MILQEGQLWLEEIFAKGVDLLPVCEHGQQCA